MIERFKQIVNDKSERDLELFIIELFNDSENSKIYYSVIEKVLLCKWHNLQEDLINLIYLKNLKYDGFVRPIFEIATNEEEYRFLDDELEPTLRKCVHALKMIDSTKSNLAIEELMKTGNENIKIVLEMYR